VKRSSLEHLIRVASQITGDNEILIIGSQAFHGASRSLPDAVERSIEADLALVNLPEKWEDIDGAIGEDSNFFTLHRYYAQGVSADTAILPLGWKDRLNYINNENTGGATGCCIGIYDLVLSKYCAEREKDFEFISEIISMDMLDQSTLSDLAGDLPVDEYRIDRIRGFIERDFRLQKANEKGRQIERMELSLIAKIANVDDQLPIRLIGARKSQYGIAGMLNEICLDDEALSASIRKYNDILVDDLSAISKAWAELKSLNPNIQLQIDSIAQKAENIARMVSTQSLEKSMPEDLFVKPENDGDNLTPN